MEGGAAMLQYNFDTSEYQQSSSAQYASGWDGCVDLSPAFFKNEVSYFSDERKLYLSVCPTYEFETLFGLYCDLVRGSDTATDLSSRILGAEDKRVQRHRSQRAAGRGPFEFLLCRL